MSGAYYNEIDPMASAAIRALMAAGHIAQGEVDERSIEQVEAADLRGFTQCHFFAGGGFWSYALRLAGWPDERPVWTGSCPCPSFSVAGKGKGFDDPRHLWPHWARLIRESRPDCIIGEQTDGAIGHGWLDLVSTDLEAEGYAVGAAVLGAHSVGAPHRRQRLYFVADTESTKLDGDSRISRQPWKQTEQEWRQSGRDSAIGGGPDSREFQREELRRDGIECLQHSSGSGSTGSGSDSEHSERRSINESRQSGSIGVASDAKQPRLEGLTGDVREWRGPGWLDPLTARSASEAGATRGFWRDCDWWYGRDGKYRPIEPGLFPLATGYPGRVGVLRLAGNSITIQVAQAFIEAYCEVVKC